MGKAGKASGFTLLELSIVLVIMAALTGMGLVATLGALESAKRAATEKKMDEIEKALMAFRLTYNRMPCPGSLTLAKTDGNYGVEAQAIYPVTDLNMGVLNCIGGTPSGNYYFAIDPALTGGFGFPFHISEGAVPVRTLNLPDDYMFDGWGRKFSYVVDSYTTIANAFNVMRPSDSCSVNVKSATADMRTAGAVYALMSFGPNGHGGYINETTRRNAGSTNPDELINCHCTSTGVIDPDQSTDMGGVYLVYQPTGTLMDAPYYTQREPSGETGDPTAFDDIVRYKVRWQMQSAEEQYTKPYRGLEMVFADGDGLHTASYECGQFKVNELLNGETGNSAAFTLNNQYVFTYDVDNGVCAMYKFSGNTSSTIADPIDSCPAGGTGGNIYMSDINSMVMGINASPYIHLWRLASNEKFYTVANPLNVSPTTQPDRISLTGDARMLALSNGVAAPIVYMLNQNTYVKLGTSIYTLLAQPSGIQSNPSALAFSPNGKYLAVSDPAGSNDVIKLWRITPNNTFIALSSIKVPTAIGGNTSFAFSRDGKYMAFTSDGYLYIYSINSGDAFIGTNVMWQGAYPTMAGVQVDNISFASDSSYLVVVAGGFGEVVQRFAPDNWGIYAPWQIYTATNGPRSVAIHH